MTVSSPGTDRFDLPLVDETVGGVIRIPGDARAEAIATSAIGFSCVVREDWRWKPIAADDPI
jgi:hypothetical protein